MFTEVCKSMDLIPNLKVSRSPSKILEDANNNQSKTPDSEVSRDTKTTSTSSRIAEKYGLRPRTIIKRIQLERTRQESLPEKESRKSKAPPLSKYRRKTANARERHRMKEINDAFATLRGILPAHNIRRQSTSASMTKITTLKMAASYIQALSDVLEEVSASDCRSLHTSHQLYTPNSTSCSYVEAEKSYQETAEFHAYPSSRGSLSSNSDLSDLLSDESGVMDDNLDAFDDIPTLQEQDPFGLLLVGDQMDIVLQS